jgi:CRP-like cAMP-binding protein
MFLVDEGQVDVMVAVPGGERHVSTLGPGDFFGEMALLDGGPRNATVRALTSCRLFALTAADLSALLERHPSIRSEVQRVVEGRESAMQAALVAAG